MDYLEMIRSFPAGRTALIEDGCRHTYGELASEAQRLRDAVSPAPSPVPSLTPSLPCSLPPSPSSSLTCIRETSVYRQLLRFLAYSGTSKVPLLISDDSRLLPEKTLSQVQNQRIPPRASMAVLTSGTTGSPSVLYRSFSSWYDFFPTQNSVFHITGDSRMFIHGSLAFTGNLNMCLGLLYAGACIITVTPVHPPSWDAAMVRSQAGCIYLIPSKLRLLARSVSCARPEIRDIISGSQSLGLADVQRLRLVYPNCRCTLYYGASELSYVSYITDSRMNDDPACIGRPFPGVRVTVPDGRIHVTTPYGAEGISMPFTVGDMGRQDAEGNLYFLGRQGRVYNIHGRKISAAKIENRLLELDGVEEAAVTLERAGTAAEGAADTPQDGVLAAYVVMRRPPAGGQDPQTALLLSRQLSRQLSRILESWEIPRKFYFPDSLPKTSSGKTIMI